MTGVKRRGPSSARLAVALIACGILAPRFVQGTFLAAPGAVVRTEVSYDAGTARYRYRYSIANTSTTMVLVGVQFAGTFTGGFAKGLSGWTLAPTFQVRVHAPDYDGTTALAPGHALDALEMVSVLLPSVGEARVFPLVQGTPWDGQPPESFAVPAIVPLIGASTDEPVTAATDILFSIRDEIIAALVADHAQGAMTLDGEITAAIKALQHHDTISADVHVRAVQAQPWSPSSAWQRELHEALRVDIAYVLEILGRSGPLDPSEVGQNGSLPNERWTFPDAMPHSTTDLKAFFRERSVAFVGTVERVSPEFVNEGDTDVRTRIVLRPIEQMYGSMPELMDRTVDVWVRGGGARRFGSWTPQVPAEIAKELNPGTRCFIAADRFEKAASPLNGQLWIAATDTLTLLDHGNVRPAAASSRWVDAVMSQGLELSNEKSDSAEAFLSTLRRAAAAPSLRSRARAYEWSANDRSELTKLFSSVFVVEQFLNEPSEQDQTAERGDLKVKEFRFADMYGDGRIELVVLVDSSGREHFNGILVVDKAQNIGLQHNPSMTEFDGFEMQSLSGADMDSLGSVLEEALQDLDGDGLPEIVMPVDLEQDHGYLSHATIQEVFQWNGRQYVIAGSKFPWYYQQLIPDLEEIARDLEATSESSLSADELRVLRADKGSIAKELAEARRRAAGKKP